MEFYIKFGLGILAVAIISALVSDVINSENRRYEAGLQRMWNDCLADGHKTYECYGMIYRRH